MGHNSSKKVDNSQTEVKGEVDKSTGFHLLEIHAPSVGMSYLLVIGLVFAALAIYGCWLKFIKHPRVRVRHQQQQLANRSSDQLPVFGSHFANQRPFPVDDILGWNPIRTNVPRQTVQYNAGRGRFQELPPSNASLPRGDVSDDIAPVQVHESADRNSSGRFSVREARDGGSQTSHVMRE